MTTLLSIVPLKILLEGKASIWLLFCCLKKTAESYTFIAFTEARVRIVCRVCEPSLCGPSLCCHRATGRSVSRTVCQALPLKNIGLHYREHAPHTSGLFCFGGLIVSRLLYFDCEAASLPWFFSSSKRPRLRVTLADRALSLLMSITRVRPTDQSLLTTESRTFVIGSC